MVSPQDGFGIEPYHINYSSLSMPTQSLFIEKLSFFIPNIVFYQAETGQAETGLRIVQINLALLQKLYA
jgi:hypothetical protein